jgi:hypothetical protein
VTLGENTMPPLAPTVTTWTVLELSAADETANHDAARQSANSLHNVENCRRMAEDFSDLCHFYSTSIASDKYGIGNEVEMQEKGSRVFQYTGIDSKGRKYDPKTAG